MREQKKNPYQSKHFAILYQISDGLKNWSGILMDFCVWKDGRAYIVFLGKTLRPVVCTISTLCVNKVRGKMGEI
jgi:hypothetical protein